MASRLQSKTCGGGRPLVIVHGWQLSGAIERADFEPAFEGVDGWKRIYPDLPGMGESTSAEAMGKIDNIHGLLEALEEFIDEVAGDQPVALAGMSTGAELVRGFVDRHPERTLGMMLRVPRLVTSYDDRSAASDDDPPELRHKKWTDAERDQYLDRDTGGVLPMPEAYREEVAAKRKSWLAEREKAEANSEFLKQIHGDRANYELKPRPFARYDKPVLVIVGRQDTRAGYVEALETRRTEMHGRPLLEQYPRATIAALDRAGHLFPVGYGADLFNALVRDWLHRMEEVSA